MSAAVIMMMNRKNHSSGHYSGGSGEDKFLWMFCTILIVLLMCCLCFTGYQEYWKTRATVKFSIVHSDGQIEKAGKRVELRTGEALRVELGITGRDDRQVRIHMYAYDDAKSFRKLVRLPTATVTHDFVFSTPGENNINVFVENETTLFGESHHGRFFELPLTVID